MHISPNAPIVGENAFLHNAELHFAAALNDPYHYEAFPAELIRRKRDFVLDKMTGLHTIKQKLKNMNLDDCNDNASRIMQYAKSKEKRYYFRWRNNANIKTF